MNISSFEWAEKNRFIVDYILNPIKRNWFEKFMYKRKLTKHLKTLSPSYIQMVKIAEFLYYIDLVCLHENDATLNGISGVVRPNINEYVITVRPNRTQSIEIILQPNETITIKTSNNNKLRNKIIFTDGNAQVNSRHKEIIFASIINSLMDTFTKVLMRYI